MKKTIVLAIIALMGLALTPAKAQWGYSGGFHNSGMSNGYSAYLAWLMYKKALENGDNMTRYWKSESSIGFASAGLVQYKLTHDFGRDAYYKEIPDSTLSGTAVPNLGFFINENVHYMLKRISDKSLVSLSIGTEVALYRWKIKGFKGNTYETEMKNAGMLTVGLPITIDYKSGCDVDFEPSGTCWAVGAGVIPQVRLTAYGSSALDKNLFTYNPYAYASFGMYFGVCMKVRFAMVPWRFVMNTATDELDYQGVDQVQTTGTGLFMLGVTLMSHSSDWDKGSAFRKPAFGGRQRAYRAGRGGRGINGRMF